MVAPNFYSADYKALGSQCRFLYKTVSINSAEEFLRDVICWVNNFEARYSRYSPDSLISEINRNAGRKWTEIDAETDKIFALCDRAVSISNGCFDPSALPLIQLWDYKASRTTIPAPEAIDETLSLVGWVVIERRKGEICLPHKGMGIDIGGIGKEYMVDSVLTLALERGIDNILVDLGQDLRVHGEPPDGGPWRIGLEDPAEPDQCRSGVAVKDCAVATSGDYRRNFSLDGCRFGHIIDPRNGYPVSNNCLAVSVIAPLCTDAGILSTAAFILGPDMGLELIESQNNAEGCIVTAAGRLESSNFDRHSLT